MKEGRLVDFFEQYLSKKSLFVNKKALQLDYVPEKILYRDEQVQQLANILAPVLRMEKPSNIFVYGKTGTGKTVTVRYTTRQLENVAAHHNILLKVLYVNCKLKKISDTEYRLLAHLCRELGCDVPQTGLPTSEIYNTFCKIIDSKKQNVIIILDEIDELAENTGDQLLYNLTRINSELKNVKVSIIGISNNLVFTENLDPRVQSSLSEEEMIFPPYNAIQLQEILKQRAAEALAKDAIGEGAIEKCAAYAAREHGDARRALELLRVAGELAEREGSPKIKIEHIDKAEAKIENDRILETVTTQPQQYQAVLYAIFLSTSQREDDIYTGDIYEAYKLVCERVGLRQLTQRRVSDIIAEFDMLGLINAKVVSKGRYGRTRKIQLSFSDKIRKKIIQILSNNLGFEGIKDVNDN
ncbi:MAG: ORC1-type DNA replication protein [Candidatus Woesearchaeota archaeon]